VGDIDLVTGKIRMSSPLDWLAGYFYQVAISPDGKTLATASSPAPYDGGSGVHS